MERADRMISPLRMEPERAAWATQAADRYLHMARIIMMRVAACPVAEAPFPAHALDLAQQLYEAIERRVDELGRPPRPDVLCAQCGARPFFPPGVPDGEAWPAICDTCGRKSRRMDYVTTLPQGRDHMIKPARTGS